MKFRNLLMHTLIFSVLTITLSAAEIQPVDLKGAANTAFADDQPGDLKGGWTDQGSNDLRVIKPGLQKIGSIPFQILNDAETAGKSCIVLGGTPLEKLPQTAVITFPQGQKGAVLYLLNAGAWVNGKKDAGAITATYADGTEQNFTVKPNRDLMDWWDFKSVFNATRVWSQYNNNSQVSLYLSKYPLDGTKELKSVRFDSKASVWMIAAVSLGDDTAPIELPKCFDLNKDLKFPAPLSAESMADDPRTGVPRNIIMIIGDGMGSGAEKFASIYAYGAPGRLSMEQLPVSTQTQTYSGSGSITDSAAAGTALSSGYKTKNAMLGMSQDKVKRLTIAESARKSGRSVALITDDAMTGATPSAYMTHQPHRGMAKEIAADTIFCGFDILIGNLYNAPFLPASVKGGAREDQRDITEELKKLGYRQAEKPADLAEFPEGKIFGFFPWKENTELAEAAENAFNRMNRNPKGFFIMIESSYPDKGGHGNNPDQTLKGVLRAEYLVQAAIRFAKAQKDTLVVVTADHETGSVTVAPNQRKPKRPIIFYSSTGHTILPVPVFAYGSGSEELNRMLNNTDIPQLFAKLWQIPLGIPLDETPKK